MEKSESIKELATALCKFQSELIDPVKDRQGYGYKFVDLIQILKLTRPVLSKNGLAVTQLLANDDSSDTIIVETVIVHTSGEWISSKIKMPVDSMKGCSRAQCIGSVISYARRYGYIASLGIGQEDDDGIPITQERKSKPVLISENTLNKVGELIAKTASNSSSIAKWGEVESLDQLSEDKGKKLIDILEKKASKGV